MQFPIDIKPHAVYYQDMKNVIEIQDEYIGKVTRTPESNYNHAKVMAQAWRKAINGLIEIGLTQTQAERAMYDANDAAALIQRAA